MDEPAVPGRVVVLNGTSSSGKSSIAARLVERLETPHYHFQRDAFNAMRVRRAMSDAQLEMALDRMVRGFHRAVAGMASTGNNLVVDHVLRESAWVSDFVSVLADDAVLVGVHCPLPQLRRRERERGDRVLGIVDFQYARVHRQMCYDIEVDTSVDDPDECAEKIIEFLKENSIPSAVKLLRSRIDASDR